MRKINLLNGEYTLVEDLSNGVFECYRKGEKWRNLTGDNMVLALIDKLHHAENLLEEAHDILDEVHCDGTKLYEEISNYLEE